MARFPVVNGEKRIKSKFGGARRHRGVDFGRTDNKGKAYKLDVLATEAGVAYTGKEAGTGYYVVLVGKTGRWLYAHLTKNSWAVRNGQKVKTGQKLALMGNTGFSFGVHLHLGLKKNGVYVDPLPYLSNSKPKKKKNIETIAKEVLKGKWGNGDTRIKKLKKAGYDPKKVQSAVNKLLRG